MAIGNTFRSKFRKIAFFFKGVATSVKISIFGETFDSTFE